MANYTQHYQLHQWEPNDNFLRTDFNGDFEKIDTALGQNCRVIHGSYTGNGDVSQFIALDEAPQVLMVFQSGQFNNANMIYGGIALPGVPSASISIDETGFTAMGNGNSSGTRPMANLNATPYHYLTFYWEE